MATKTKAQKSVKTVSQVGEASYEPLPIIVLEIDKHCSALDELYGYNNTLRCDTWKDGLTPQRYQQAMSLTSLIAGHGPSPIVFKRSASETCPIYGMVGRTFYVVMDKRGVLWGVQDNLFCQETFTSEVEDALDSRYEREPSAVWLERGAEFLEKDKRAKHAKRGVLLLNGDETDLAEDDGGFDDLGPVVTLVPYNDKWEMPVVSFNCLERLLFPPNAKLSSKTRQGLVSALVAQKLVLRDYTFDEVIEFTKAEQKLAKQHDTTQNPEEREKLEPLVPPQAGFSRLAGTTKWHRSGTALFEYEPPKGKNRFFIVGADEGTYFGCELSKSAKTITEAFEALVPPEARNTDYRRQGEWFVVPYKGKLPPVEERVLMFSTERQYDDSCVYLPLETPDSNKHAIGGEDGFVSRDGRVFVLNPRLEHEEHSAVMRNGWCRFFKNTALRSVSQKGVD